MIVKYAGEYYRGTIVDVLGVTCYDTAYTVNPLLSLSLTAIIMDASYRPSPYGKPSDTLQLQAAPPEAKT